MRLMKRMELVYLQQHIQTLSLSEDFCNSSEIIRKTSGIVLRFFLCQNT